MDEDVPSAETNSVVVPEYRPPINRTSPDWRPQQIWNFLHSTRLTANASNVETPSNFSQDLNVESPPQRRLLQKLARIVPLLIFPAGHDSFENGLNFSVGSGRPPSVAPATMIKPPVNS